MRIAVTGGRGLLGRALARLAVAEGHHLISVDRSDEGSDEGSDEDSDEGSDEGGGAGASKAGDGADASRNGPGDGSAAERADAVEQRTADVTDYDEFRSTVEGADALVHLAAYISPRDQSDHVVHNTNVVASYNALSVAVSLGIRSVCLASSVNAIGGQYSRRPRYDYFPVDELHPTYAEDPYSLSKWLAERQADAFARRHEQMTISSLRFHALRGRDDAKAATRRNPEANSRDLWGYTPLDDGARACLSALNADYRGHEVFYIVAEESSSDARSAELRDHYYPTVPIVGDLGGHRSFFDVSKARRLLDWPPRRSDAPAPR